VDNLVAKEKLVVRQAQDKFPPALQVLGEICSNFFVKRPPDTSRNLADGSKLLQLTQASK